jgi:hypothetical protein
LGILSFRNVAPRRNRAPAQDWSPQEIADFCRAQRLLQQNGIAFGFDRGITDIGEPWMCFYDYASNDVFLHVARIDDQCILVCERLSISLTASDIPSLIYSFEEAVRGFLAFGVTRKDNVVIHPAAKIIMSISAVFLLLKFDDASQAQAAEPAFTTAEAQARKEVSTGLLARAQSQLARIFDAVDSPAAIAALAGIILTSEIFKSQATASSLTTTEGHDIELAQLDLDAGVRPVNLKPIDSIHANDGFTSADGITLGIEEMLLAVAADAPVDSEIVALVASLLSVSSAEFAVHPDDAEVRIDRPLPSNVVVWQSTQAPPAPEGAADAGAPETSLVAENLKFLSSRTLLEVAGVDLGKLAADKEPAVGEGQPSTPIAVGDKLEVVGNITLADLEKLESRVGFVAETAIGGDELGDLLLHMLKQIDAFSFEGDSTGRILVEQHGLTGLSVDQIGIWTETMSDGSSISVVGLVDIIDDVGSFFQIAA